MPPFNDLPDRAVEALESVPGRDDLAAFVRKNRQRRFYAAYHQGRRVVEEEFESIDISRGAQLAELHYDDGRYVTVRVGRDIEEIAALGARA